MFNAAAHGKEVRHKPAESTSRDVLPDRATTHATLVHKAMIPELSPGIISFILMTFINLLLKPWGYPTITRSCPVNPANENTDVDAITCLLIFSSLDPQHKFAYNLYTTTRSRLIKEQKST